MSNYKLESNQVAEAYQSINTKQELVIDESTDRHPSHSILEGYASIGKPVGQRLVETTEEVVETVSNEVEHDERSMSFMVNEMLKLDDKIEDAKDFLESINDKTFGDLTESDKIATIKLYTTFRSDAMDVLTTEEIIDIGATAGVEDLGQFVEFITTRFEGEFDNSYVKTWADRIVEGTVKDYADSKTLEVLESIK